MPEIEVIPTSTEYVTTLGLGIKFKLPKSWIGKCRVVERKDVVSVYFMPTKPTDQDTWLFSIERKTDQTAGDEQAMGNVCEFTVNGVAYFWGGPTGEYSGPESGTYIQLREDFDLVYLSIRQAS